MNAAKSIDPFHELSPPFKEDDDLALFDCDTEQGDWEDESTSFFARPIPLTEQREPDARVGEDVSRVVDVAMSDRVRESGVVPSAERVASQGENRAAFVERDRKSGLAPVMAGIAIAAATLAALIVLRSSPEPVTQALKNTSEFAIATVPSSAEPAAVPAAVAAPSPTRSDAEPQRSTALADHPASEVATGSRRATSNSVSASAARGRRTNRTAALPTPTRYENGSFRPAR